MVLFIVELIIVAIIVIVFSIVDFVSKKNKPEKKKNEDKENARALFYLGALLSSEKSEDKRRSNRCDGDCANCPPHYGYRYGRWYYGHGHIEGCERGGNKADGGMD